MGDDQALEAIRRAWIDWATHQITEPEFAARIAEALEASGREVVGEGFAAANDEEPNAKSPPPH